MNNEERKDIEDKINGAMAQIVSDTVGEAQAESGRSGGKKIGKTSEISKASEDYVCAYQ